MGRRGRSGFKINTGKWGKPTSVRIGKRGKGNINVSKRGVKANPGCCLVLIAFCGSIGLIAATVAVAV